jgi:hypothetical protein
VAERLFRVKTHANPNLNDDKVVEEMMNDLMEQHPAVHGYQYERVDSETLHILMWGDIVD